MANFAVTMADGPRWDGARAIRDQDGWQAHADFMDALVDDGFVIIGGPLGSGQRLIAVEAPDEQAVRDRLAADPWVLAGLLRVSSVQPWSLWLDSRKTRIGTLTEAADKIVSAAEIGQVSAS
ncbi:MAG TPA: YciI family protein [Streptosporangiaceae bacterium]|jgi:uncharacterized protein YciI|nr:YciI family protein [Streptosporangiaceae bacterium]